MRGSPLPGSIGGPGERGGQIIRVLVLGYSLTASALVFPLVLGHFWRGATRPAAIASMLAGALGTGLFTLVPPLTALLAPVPPITAGLTASLLTLVVVSLLTRKR